MTKRTSEDPPPVEADNDPDASWPATGTKLCLAIVLLLLTWWGFHHITTPLDPEERTGFAWLATPVNLAAPVDAAHLVDPLTKPADLTMKVDAAGEYDSSPPQEINIEYDILVPCGSKSTQVALYLAGDAQLSDIHIIGPKDAHSRTVVGELPELGRQSMQLISGTIVDGPLCSVKGAAKDVENPMVVTGRWRHSFFQHTYSKGSVTLPVVGRPWPESRAVGDPPGLNGTWSAPIPSTVSADVFGLQPTDRIDLARPPTDDGADLVWHHADNLRVLAVWTDINADQHAQIYTFLLGLLGGIGGALLVEAVLPPLVNASNAGARKLRNRRKPRHPPKTRPRGRRK